MSGNHWGSLVESGMITGSVQVRISQLLDMPRRWVDSHAMRYLVRASDPERELGVTPLCGGIAPPEAERENVSLGPDGVLQLNTAAVVLYLQVEFDNGQPIGRCQISRLDPRSPKAHQYGLIDVQGQPAGCGVELTVVEGRASLAPCGAAAAAEPGAAGAAPPALPNGTPPLPAGSAAALGRELTLRVTRLLDVPRRVSERGIPVKYVVRALDRDSELGAVEVDGAPPPRPGSGAASVETVGLGPRGVMRLRTELPMLTIRVDYSDNRPLGFCQIHRQDPRSASPSAYLLSDPAGASANCGVELQVTEEAIGTAHGAVGAAPAGAIAGTTAIGTDIAPAGNVGSGAGGFLQVRILAAFNLLNRDTGLFGDVSDPFVKAKVGSIEYCTPTIDNDLNPIWRTGNEFSFPIDANDSSLELEVLNANYVHHDSLGRAAVGLWSLPPGEWLRRRERLQDGQSGELEFEVRFDPPQAQLGPRLPGRGEQPLPASSAAVPVGSPAGGLPPMGVPPALPPGAPPFAPSPLPNGLPKGIVNGLASGMPGAGVPGSGSPTGAWPGASLPPSGAPLGGPLVSGGCPQHPAAFKFPFKPKAEAVPGSLQMAMEQGWSAPMVMRGLGPLAMTGKEQYQDPLGLYPDMFSYEFKGHEPMELWMKTPAPSAADLCFGADLDLEVLAFNSEPWRAPLPAVYREPSFEPEGYFPDMDVGLLARKAGNRAPRLQDRQMASQRRKEGLPELALDRWVAPAKPRPALPPPAPAATAPEARPRPKPLTAPVPHTVPSVAAKGACAPRSVAEARRLRHSGKLKVEVELVRPEQARDIEQQCMSPELTSLDHALEPDVYEAQVVGCLENNQATGAEKGVWARSPRSGTERLSSSSGDEAWLEPFQADALLVGASCRRGQRGVRDPLPAQDSFSMTRVSGETSLYVVCDGHGPFGHLAAFRVAQSLPKLAAEALHAGGQAGGQRQLPEQALLEAFEGAQRDLAAFADALSLDLSRSGTSCVVALRLGADVQVAWLGDARAMVATVTEDRQKVDMVTPAHTTEDVKEYQRVRHRGAVLRQLPAGVGPHRLFAPNERGPGLLATRSLGDLSAQPLGVAWQPDIRKMSFASTPGLVLLGSGGLWTMLDDNSGDALLGLLLREGGLRQHGPRLATPRLTEAAQERWREVAEGCCDDATGLVLQWTRAAPPPVPAPRPPPMATLPPGQVEATGQPAKLPPSRTLTHEEMQQIQLHGGNLSTTPREPGQEPEQGSPSQAAATALPTAPPDQPKMVGSVAQYMAWRTQFRPEGPPPALTEAPPPAVVLEGPRAVLQAAPTCATAAAVTHEVAVAPPATPAVPARVSGGGRLKPTTLHLLQLGEDLDQQGVMFSEAEPDAALLPDEFLVQVIGCMEAADTDHAEPTAWLRAHFAAPVQLDLETAAEQLRDFHGSSPMRLAVKCRRGRKQAGTLAANQDNFSVTYAQGDRAVYTVCDGHGPLGHVAAFRVAQSLPKYVLEGLSGTEAVMPAENVIAKAFDSANSELTEFAKKWGWDISGSGTTAALALRQGDGVHVAWVGDSRVLVATVVGEDSRVDLMAKAHSPAEPAERQRLAGRGAELQPDPLLPGPDGTAALRVFAGAGVEAPGLSVSRAIGDTALSRLGVISHPDLAKTSFEYTPGLVLLASGGLCEFLGTGEALLDALLHRGRLAQLGPQQALSCLCDFAQECWKQQEADYCDDITGLLLYWHSEDESPTVFQASLSEQSQLATVPTLAPVPAPVAPASQRFLQACPVGGSSSVAAAAASQEAPQTQRFLQAVPPSQALNAKSVPTLPAGQQAGRPQPQAVAARLPVAAPVAVSTAVDGATSAAMVAALRKAALPTVPE